MAENTSPKTSGQLAKRFGMNTMLMWLGAVLIFLGSFFTWVDAGIVSASGFDGSDGKLTALIGLVLGFLGAYPFLKNKFIELSDKAREVSMLLLSVVAGFIVAVNMADVREAKSSIGETGELLGISLTPSIGVGAWMVLIGGLIGVVAAAMMRSGSSASSLSDVKKLSDNAKQQVGMYAGFYVVLMAVLYFVA